MIPRYRSPFGIGEVLRAALRGMRRTERAPISGLPHRAFLSLLPSASDALHVALRGFGPSGRVALPAYTCIRVVEAIRSAGWSPVYVDIDPTSGAMDPVGLADLLSVGVPPDVVLATHLHGTPTSIDDLLLLAARAGSRVVEDCAMAQGAMHDGAPVGSFGDAAIFSFGLGKVLSAGAGGALLSDARSAPVPSSFADSSRASLFALLSRAGIAGDVRFLLQEKIKRWRSSATTTRVPKGFEPTRWHNVAEATLAQLVSRSGIEEQLEQQRQRSERWHRFVLSLQGGSISTFRVTPGDRPCYPGLPLLVEDRERLQRTLRAHGVDTARFFDYCAATRDGARGSFPNSEAIAGRIIILPLDLAIDARATEIQALLSRHAREG